MPAKKSVRCIQTGVDFFIKVGFLFNLQLTWLEIKASRDHCPVRLLNPRREEQTRRVVSKPYVFNENENAFTRLRGISERGCRRALNSRIRVSELSNRQPYFRTESQLLSPFRILMSVNSA